MDHSRSRYSSSSTTNSTDCRDTSSEDVDQTISQSRLSPREVVQIQSTDSGTWDWNITTNETFMSPRFRELLGLDDEDYYNLFLPWSTRIHPQDFDRTMDALADHLENHLPFKVEYRLRKKDGTYEWFSARGQATWDKDGRAQRMSGSLQVITDQSAIAEARRKSAANNLTTTNV